jgi:hypothetical protein
MTVPDITARPWMVQIYVKEPGSEKSRLKLPEAWVSELGGPASKVTLC